MLQGAHGKDGAEELQLAAADALNLPFGDRIGPGRLVHISQTR